MQETQENSTGTSTGVPTEPFMDQSMARRLFTSKSAVIRHVVKQAPDGENLTAREIMERANNLIRKLPEDMQAYLYPVNLTLIYEARREKNTPRTERKTEPEK